MALASPSVPEISSAIRRHGCDDGGWSCPSTPRPGCRNIAAALRRNARDASRVLPLLGITNP